MGETSGNKKGIEELLEKIPVERRWAITAKTLLGLMILQGEKIVAPEMGKDEGITAPVLGAEKWIEINVKTTGEGILQFIPYVKETFNIPVENAVEAAKLIMVVPILMFGPEFKCELVEEGRERAVLRWTKCALWESYKEHDVDPAFIPCDAAHQMACEEGFKTINPKLTGTFIKSRLRGDPYCEDVYEFKEE